MENRMPWLALALIALAAPALAQSPESTRAEEARSTRERKASAPAVAAPGKVERLFNWIETGWLFQSLAGTRDGFGIRVGGIEDGAGFALGPSWRASNVLDGAVHISTSAAASLAGDREVAAGFAVPHIAADRLAVGVNLAATHLAQERFFGRGMGSAQSDATAFALDRRRVVADATLTATDWLRVSGTAGTLRATTADAHAPHVPPIATRFTAADAPGVGVENSFAVLSMSATADFRNVPQNPRDGGRYHVAASRYAAMDQRPHSFTRVDAEVEQHFSAWKRQRLITLRAVASTTITADGHEVPFYLQPTLGGSQLLRGFVTDRFRDRSLLAVQAEYGWDLTPFMNAVLFYEAGTVAPRLRDIRAGDFRRDYGIGFRFGSARTVAFRTDVALGSGEGARLTMRFNHAF
jgi:outer membrane protein assembly factor BamA